MMYRKCLSLALVLFLALCAPGANAMPQSEAVRPQVQLDLPVLLAGSKGPVYVLVRFKVAQPDQSAEQPRLNLGLVLDRSGSMSGQGKMEYLKIAAKMLAERLGPRDYLSVVEYDDRINVLWPSSLVEDPAEIKAAIERLYPRGTTNLTGGLMAGVRQVQTSFDASRLNQVILISDGLANRGITDPARIRQLVRQAKSAGVRVTTIGLGQSYNEDLMTDIAEAGGGNYYYVEGPAQLARIFQRELSTLFTTVARDFRLEFRAGPYVRRVVVFGYEHTIEGQRTVVEMPNFFGGEERTLLLRLDLRSLPQQEGRLVLGELRFKYFDVLSQQPRQGGTELTARLSEDSEEVARARNKGVAVESLLVEAEQRQKKILALYQKGRHRKAQEQVAGLSRRLAEANRDLKDKRLARKIEGLKVERRQMRRMAAAPAPARSAYLKRSKQRVYQAMKGSRAMQVLKPGSRGLMVERLQKALKGKGLYQGKIDGVYSPQVTKAVKALQKKRGLTIDGVAGPRVLSVLGLY